MPVEVDTRIEVRIRYQYADTGAVERVLSECSAEDVSTEYGVGVIRVVRISPADVERLLPSLTEATAGRASLDS